MKRSLYLIFAALLTACGSPEPASLAPAANAVDIADTSMGTAIEVSALTPEDIIRDSRQDLLIKVEAYLNHEDGAAAQDVFEWLSLVGREDLIDVPIAMDRCPRRWVDPLDSLRASLGKQQVVVVYDSGYSARQRAFIADITSALIDEGFTHYASDAFNLNNPPLHISEHSDPTEDIIATAPLWGRLIDTLKDNDMSFTSLNMPALTLINDPEARTPENLLRLKRIAQADQVALNIFKFTPEARVILHLASPVSETPEVITSQQVSSSFSAFAKRLEDNTGITPLFIGQSRCNAGWTGSVMIPALGRGGAYTDKFSIVVAHPDDRSEKIRPKWRRENGDTDVSIPPVFKSDDLPVIIEARKVGEADTTIPGDRLLLLPGDELPLILPTGKYRIEGWTKNGPVAEPVLIEVNAPA